jgi:hypothetical protein
MFRAGRETEYEGSREGSRDLVHAAHGDGQNSVWNVLDQCKYCLLERKNPLPERLELVPFKDI